MLLIIGYSAEGAANREALDRSASRWVGWLLINERHVTHYFRFRLRVQHDPMPIGQRDRRVIWMTDPALRVNARIASLSLPAPLRRTGSAQQFAIPSFADSVRVFRTHVNEFARDAEELFHKVGLARTAS